MSFRSRILLALLAVGAVPAAMVGAFSWNAHSRELAASATRAQEALAQEAAVHTGQLLASQVDGLRLAVDYLPVAALEPAELAQVLALPFRQLPALSALAVLDGRGAALAPPLLRDAADRETLADFAGRIPFKEALDTAVVVGQPHLRENTAAPRLAVAVRVEPSPGEVDNGARVLAGELSLSGVTGHLDALSAGGRYSALWDEDRARFYASGGAAGLGADEDALVRSALATRRATTGRLRDGNGTEWLLTAAPVPGTGWGLCLAEPLHAALAPARRIARYSVYWISAALLLAVVLGLLLSAGIGAPVRALTASARALAGGDDAQRAPTSGGAELSELAVAFNAMAEEIQQRDREIRAFNLELQRRVEEKTAELAVAREQVERSRRLSAMASLGAGMAHELNNPLTTVLGLTTLVRDEVPDGSAHAPLLDQVITDANRIAKIVEAFRTLTEAETHAAEAVDLGALARAVVTELGAAAKTQRVDVAVEAAPDAPPAFGRPADLGMVVRELCTNALQAMPEGGRMQVRVDAPEHGLVRLSVEDTGPGIPEAVRERIFDPFFTTRPEGSGTGMGLTVAHRIVDAHHGRIMVKNAPTKGSILQVLLPAAAVRPHLR